MKLEITAESLARAKKVYCSAWTMQTGFAMGIKEAQAWADAIISKYEAQQKTEPKTFGVGTRLRAKNGDELLVVGNLKDADLGLLNLTTAHFLEIEDVWWWNDTILFQAALLASGAMIVDD